MIIKNKAQGLDLEDKERNRKFLKEPKRRILDADNLRNVT